MEKQGLDGKKYKYPSLSIVIPALEINNMFHDTVGSIVQSDVDGIEILVVYSGSESVQLLNERINNQRIIVLKWPQEGIYAAVVAGMQKATGEVVGWIGCGDMYLPRALDLVRVTFHEFKSVNWLTTNNPMLVSESGNWKNSRKIAGYSKEAFDHGLFLPGGKMRKFFIQQESTFWRRKLLTNDIVENLKLYRLAGDYFLWASFFNSGQVLHDIDAPIAGFRIHNNQASSDKHAYFREAQLIHSKFYNDKHLLYKFLENIKSRFIKKRYLSHSIIFDCNAINGNKVAIALREFT